MSKLANSSLASIRLSHIPMLSHAWLTDLSPKWVRLAPNGTNQGHFQSGFQLVSFIILARWSQKKKTTKICSEKFQDLFHLGANVTYFLAKNLTPLFDILLSTSWLFLDDSINKTTFTYWFKRSLYCCITFLSLNCETCRDYQLPIVFYYNRRDFCDSPSLYLQGLTYKFMTILWLCHLKQQTYKILT